MNRTILAMILTLAFAPHALAKGLDDLTPETPSQKEGENASDAATAKPAEPKKEEPVKEASPAGAKPEEKKADVKQAAPDPEAKPIEPSATSRKLADRLSVSTGLYLNRLQGTKGDWNAGGGRSEVGVQYMFAKDPFQSGMLKHVSFLASLRYAPVDVTLRSKRQSYKGILQGYHVGMLMSRLFNERFRSIGGVELSYYSAHLESVDTFDEKLSSAKNGGGATFLAGCDWIFQNKMTLGPRADVSIGNYHGFSLGGAVGFVF